MTETRNYAAKLERRLIEEFKQKFEEKLGYTPIVLTKVSSQGNDDLPIMSLEQLAGYFEPFLPVVYGNTVRLQSISRKRELVELRNIFCAVARMMRFTCVSIGEFLGGRDHTTVLHNVGTFNNLVETSESFREKYFLILTHIKESYESSALVEPDQTQCQPQLTLFS
jgi:hypothetical protein